MKKLLNKIALMLAILVFSVGSVSAKGFSDVNADHWAQKEIDILAKDNVVVGYPDGTFHPDQPVTKAEFVTMVIKALWQQNYDHEQIYYYKDVPLDHWAYQMIQIATDFDLLTGYPDGYFKPDENLKKAEAVSIVISSVDAENINEATAKKLLSVYKDVNLIPASALIPAGKAQKYSLIITPPEEKGYFNPEKNITRAEMSAMLYNMRKQALLHPNQKLKKVFTPKKGNGIVLDNVEMDSNGFIAYIPAGTVLEGVLSDDNINSQHVAISELRVVKTKDNYVTKQSYLLFPAGTNIAGEVVAVKKARYILRNAKLDLEAKRVTMENGCSAPFDATMQPNAKKQSWFSKIYRAVVKGKKIIINKGDTVYVKLTKPVKFDTAKTKVIYP